MIRLRRPACPKRLATEGAEQTAALCKAAGASAAAAEGLRERDFHAAVYAHPEVRQTLWAMQHGKCAYCEKPLNEENAEVEHFRPKSAWQELASPKLSRPGYY